MDLWKFNSGGEHSRASTRTRTRTRTCICRSASGVPVQKHVFFRRVCFDDQSLTTSWPLHQGGGHWNEDKGWSIALPSVGRQETFVASEAVPYKETATMPREYRRRIPARVEYVMRCIKGGGRLALTADDLEERWPIRRRRNYGYGCAQGARVKSFNQEMRTGQRTALCGSLKTGRSQLFRDVGPRVWLTPCICHRRDVSVCVCVCVCVCVYVCACARARVHACVRTFVYSCVGWGKMST